MDPEEIAGLISQQGDAIAAFRKHVDTSLDTERKEREALEARINRGGGHKGGGGDATPEHKALGKFVRTGDDAELKTNSVGSDPDGGYLVMPVMSDQMTTRLYDQSPMRRISRIETITTGDAFEEIDDRDEIGAEWVGESEGRPETDTAELDKWRIPVGEIYALQRVTQRLLDDANRDVGAWVDGKITDKFGRSEGTAFITGDGLKGKPRGLLTYDTVTDDDFTRAAGKIQYVPTGNASNFPASNPADVLRTLMWTLRAPYRNGAVWQMNSNTASVVDKFKDGMGNYLWRDAMTDGAAPNLLGYRVEINEDFPDIGAGEYPIAFGNFTMAYIIVDKAGIKFLRDPFTSKPNVLFYAYRRIGGGLANDDAVKLLKVAAS
ncbi:phage major capsid protein [Devosia sp.]|uniref:phage major capsid protein n=1 Tax=Devosia sp. TaxID=1871048 RepID=UPI0019E78072|nr:phage major capsid protein [Devosia sp.]MBE0580820.1 phage major capsid protein [Devosia sp.]